MEPETCNLEPEALQRRASNPLEKHKGEFNRDKGDTGDKNRVNMDKRDKRGDQHLGNLFFSLYPSPPSPSSLLDKADFTGIKRVQVAS